MATNCEKIYEKYRNSDFVSRLHIYLQFPELRNDFLKIDQSEPNSDFFNTANHFEKAGGLWVRIIHRIRGIIRPSRRKR